MKIMYTGKVRPKWGFIPFSQTFQQNAPCLKLFRNMPLFWNSIFRKSSFKCKTQFLDNRAIAKLNSEYIYIYILFFSGTRIPLEYFQGTLVPQFFFFSFSSL